MFLLADNVERVIGERPGSTATQLARTLYGPDGYQERINPSCRLLCRSGRIRREGSGGPGDPYRHFPANQDILKIQMRTAGAAN